MNGLYTPYFLLISIVSDGIGVSGARKWPSRPHDEGRQNLIRGGSCNGPDYDLAGTLMPDQSDTSHWP